MTAGLQLAGLQSVPRAPGAIPLLGHALKLWRDPFGFLVSLPRRGDLVRVDLGTLPMYVVTTAELVYEITATKARSFEKGRFFDRLRPLAGNGLANSDGEVHRKHRRLIQPLFSKDRIAAYSEVMVRHSLELADSWPPGQVVEVEKATATFVIESLTATLFSTGIGLPAVDAVRRNLPVVLKNLLIRAASPGFLDRVPIRPNRDFDAAAATLRRVIDEVVAKARRSGYADQDDLLSLLLAAHDAESGESLSDLEVRDELSTILFAGVETTAATLAWAFHELAAHPEVADRVAAEVEEVVGDRPVTIADVPRLVTLRRVLDETIRLHGVTLLMRRTREPVELAGFQVPAGTEVAFSLYAVHRDGRLYTDPDRFDPDRWLPERQTASGRGREAYIPFGAGQHKCIGESFFLAEATVAIATVLAKWRLVPAAGYTPDAVVSAVPHPRRIPMTVAPRRS
ncbi:cytochrome P450 [Streptomyces sp. NPDC055078]